MRLSVLSTAVAERAGVLCCVLFLVISAQALAQTSATDNPGPTAAQPSVAAEEKPAVAAEEKPPAADDKPATAEQKPAPAEEKPAIAQDKPAAVEEKSAATDDKPAIVEQKPAPAEEKLNGCAGQARSRRGEAGRRGRQACHRRADVGHPGREACGCRAEAGSCGGKTSGCAREACLEAKVCRQAIRKRCPQQRGGAQQIGATGQGSPEAARADPGHALHPLPHLQCVVRDLPRLRRPDVFLPIAGVGRISAA